jgi:glycosyltransferase involved in cell wall biosynthesis
MNTVFLSCLFPEELKKTIEANSKSGIQHAANKLQWNFVLGLDSNQESPIRIITAPIIGSYPLLYKRLFLNRLSFTHTKNSKDVSVGYCNLAVVKNYFVRKSLFKELVAWADQNPTGTNLIIVYSILAPQVLAVARFKEKHPEVKTCLIVPDLPEFMNNSKNPIYKLRELLQPDLYPHISVFDSFVFLTSEMARHFNVTDKPWVTIEGMVDPAETTFSAEAKDPQKRILMYSGTLDERYGVLDLVAAFEAIDDSSYELWICGTGNSQALIKSKSLSNNRIKYWGLLPRENVLELQRRASVLINPRSSEGEYTKYSFPSKIMEYLLSGTPCIIKPLPGIPDEYYNYIFMVQDDKIASLKNKIEEVCSLSDSELKNRGESAKAFVLEKKNYTIQTKKMTDMFKAFA